MKNNKEIIVLAEHFKKPEKQEAYEFPKSCEPAKATMEMEVMKYTAPENDFSLPYDTASEEVPLLDLDSCLKRDNQISPYSMSVTNRISFALGMGDNERTIEEIALLVIHHTSTVNNSQPHFNSAHYEAGWRTNPSMGAPNARGGYHELILYNGNVEINMQDERRTWGAGDGGRWDMWHISLVGRNNTHQNAPSDYPFLNNLQQRQLDSLVTRIVAAFLRFGWTSRDVWRILRHRDLPNFQGWGCNNINLADIRNQVVSRVPADPVPDVFRSGDFIQLAPNTLWYGTRVQVPIQIRNVVNRIHQIQGNRVSIFHNESVVGAVRLQDLRRLDGLEDGTLLPPSSGGFNVGDSVRLASNAVWYGTITNIPQFVRDRLSQILEIVGNRVVITYRGEVVGAVRLQDLRRPDGSGGGTVPPSPSGGFNVGDSVRLASNAVWYGTSMIIPQFVRDRLSQILEIIDNRVVITYSGEVIGAVRLQDLRRPDGSGGGTVPRPPNGGFNVGDSVRLASNAVWYGTSMIIPQFVRDRLSQILEIVGNRVVITYRGEVVGAVRLQDLRK